MSASFLTRSLTKEETKDDHANGTGDGTSQAAEANGDRSSSSSSIVPAAVTSEEPAAVEGSLLKGSLPIRTKKSMVILSDYAVCRSFAAALHGYSKSVLGPVLTLGGQQQQQQQQKQQGGSDPASSGDCTQQHQDKQQEKQQQQSTPEMPVHYVLPPLQKVAEWLAIGLEDAIITALKGQDEGGASGDSSSSSSKPRSPKKAAAKQQQQQQQLSPLAIAAQVQAASQAAACGLVLVTLLARAAVPVLQELQQALQQLPVEQPAEDAAADADSAAATKGGPADALIADLVAVDLVSGLFFVRAAYQALCARCYLTQVLNGLPAKLFQNGKAAGGAAAGEDAAALRAVKAALRGEGLARGWAHLVQPVPQGVVVRVRGFQERHPGDFVASLSLVSQLVPVDVVAAEPHQQQQQQLEGSNSQQAAAAADAGPHDQSQPLQQQQGGSSQQDGAAAEDDDEQQLAVYRLPGELKLQLEDLIVDLLGLFGSLLTEVPLPVGCNNPACTNLEGVAEASLSVNKRCSSCLAAHYCSKQCQTEHWASHKGACSRIKTLTAA